MSKHSPLGQDHNIVTALRLHQRSLRRCWKTSSNIGNNKSFVYDLNKERGIVRTRVALVPRSAEIKPLFWRFVHSTHLLPTTQNGVVLRQSPHIDLSGRFATISDICQNGVVLLQRATFEKKNRAERQIRERQRVIESDRERQRDTERHRETQRDTERHIETYRDI